VILLGFLWLIVGPPLIAGTLYAVIGVLVRGRFGAFALLLLTLAALAVAITIVEVVPFPNGAFAIPAIPAVAVAAPVLEWRARRHSRPAVQVVWTLLTFTAVGSVVLYDVVGQMMIVA
jgi:peptidoglycan/LPS O-acetylase OafA/YrhL